MTNWELFQKVRKSRLRRLWDWLTTTADDDTMPHQIPCCFCGRPTIWDPTYNDLCYRCIRADNE